MTFNAKTHYWPRWVQPWAGNLCRAHAEVLGCTVERKKDVERMQEPEGKAVILRKQNKSQTKPKSSQWPWLSQNQGICEYLQKTHTYGSSHHVWGRGSWGSPLYRRIPTTNGFWGGNGIFFSDIATEKLFMFQ